MKISDKAKKWIKAAAVRTVKTMAETAIALIGTNTIGITDVDWCTERMRAVGCCNGAYLHQRSA